MKLKMATGTTNGDNGKGNSGGKTKLEVTKGDDKEGNNSRRATTNATRKTGTAT